MTITRTGLTTGSVLLAAVMGANFLNFLFNALLGRWLSVENFSLITLIITFYYLSSILTKALSVTINFSVSKLQGEGKPKLAYAFFKALTGRSVVLSLGLMIVWILAIPVLKQFFHVETSLPFLAFAPILVFSTYAYDVIGYLQGGLRFIEAATMIIAEPLMKLVSGAALVFVGLGAVSYLSLPFSLLAASAAGGLLLLTTKQKSEDSISFRFPRQFFFTTLGTAVGSTLFFSIDLMLVRHFFIPEVSGQYAIISLIGKMMFFFSTILNTFTVTLVSREQNRQKLHTLWQLFFLGTAGLSAVAWVALGGFGRLLVPLLFGDKVTPVLELLPLYTLGIALYSLSSILVSYYLARQKYLYSYCQVVAAILLGLLIFVRHGSLAEVIQNITIVGFSLLSTLLFFHFKSFVSERLYVK